MVPLLMTLSDSDPDFKVTTFYIGKITRLEDKVTIWH